MRYKELKELEGKRISVNLKSGTYFNGVVTEVVDTGDNMIWVHLIDKFNKLAVFLSSEIVELSVR